MSNCGDNNITGGKKRRAKATVKPAKKTKTRSKGMKGGKKSRSKKSRKSKGGASKKTKSRKTKSRKTKSRKSKK